MAPAAQSMTLGKLSVVIVYELRVYKLVIEFCCLIQSKSQLVQAIMPVSVESLKGAKEELKKIISSNSCGPILIRIGWHDAGTYDAVRFVPSSHLATVVESRCSCPSFYLAAVRLMNEIKAVNCVR